MTKILFAAYGGGHMKALIPVIEKLRDAHECVVLALTSAAGECKTRGIPYKTMRDFAYLYPEPALEKGRELAMLLNNLMQDAEESAAYLGISYQDLQDTHGPEQAAELYQKSGRAAFSPVGAMEKLLNEIKPDFVVTTNSPRSERALQEAAGKLGIPSLCIVDFYPGAEFEWLAKPGYATKLCVIDEHVKAALIKHGRAAGDIEITGNPAFDHYGSPGAQEEAAAYRKKHLGKAKALIAFASNLEPCEPGEVPLQDQMLDALQRICAELGYVLSLRRHPSEAARPLPENILNGNQVSLEIFVSSSDAMVTFPSTIAYEARLLGVPVIVLAMSKLAVHASYLNSGDYISVQDENALFQALQDISAQTKQPPAGPQTAAQRVVDIIGKITCNG